MAQQHHVPLSRLVHDCSQSAYKDLHATIDTLGETDDASRRAKLLEYAVRTRHRITRLLVAVRWFMDYSAFQQSATIARDTSLARAAMYVQSADTLWATAQTMRAAQSVPIFVAPAAEVMAGHEQVARIPKMIETIIDLDLDDMATSNHSQDQNDDAILRLGTVTRQFVRENLPKGVNVISWRVQPGDAAVRIGLPGVWHADVILDRLQMSDACIRILSLGVHISSHRNAGGPMQRISRAGVTSSSFRRLLNSDEEDPMRQMIEDRMHWALKIDEASPHTHRTGWRGRKMLDVLAGVMECEVCAQFAMDHIRAQSSWLQCNHIWRTSELLVQGISHLSDSHSPVVIQYWRNSFTPASITIRPSDVYQLPENDAGTRIVHVSHDPALLGVEGPFIELTAIDVEDLLLQVARVRGRKLLSELASSCTDIPFLQHIDQRQCTGMESMCVGVVPGCCLRISVSLKTGSWNTRVLGACVQSNRREFLEWNIGRQFKSMEMLRREFTELFRRTLDLVSRSFKVRVANSLDLCCMETYAPGSMSVEQTLSPQGTFDPPLLAVQQFEPRSFLSLVSVDATSEHLSPVDGFDPYAERQVCEIRNKGNNEEHALKRERITDGLGIVKAKRRRTCGMDFGLSDDAILINCDFNPVSSASAFASLACSLFDTEAHLRRDQLIEMLLEEDCFECMDAVGSASPFRTTFQLPTEPLPVLSAELQLRGRERWEVHLTLLTDLMEDSYLSGGVVKYLSGSQTLVFSYPNISKVAVRSFQYDLLRARAAAMLIRGVVDHKSNIYKIQRRTHSCVEVRLHDVRMIVGFVKDGFQVSFNPSKPFLQQHFAPLVEELLNATGEIAGNVLAALLETGWPIATAIDRAMPDDPKLWKVAFSSCLRARVVLRGVSEIAHALDVDGRVGGGKATIIDYARALALTPEAIARRTTVFVSYKPLPRWDALLERLVSTGDGQGMHSGSAIVVSMNILAKVLTVIVDCARKGDRQATSGSQVGGR